MILTKYDIQQEMDLGNVVIQPFNSEQLGPNSYDVRLGNEFYLTKYDGDQPCFYGPVRIADDEPLYLPAGETILAYTKEVIGANDDIVCQVRAKSSTRRCGISICDDAGFGDVGYVDHWTLELTSNVKPYAVVRPNQLIGQIVFIAAGCARPKKNTINQARYVGQYLRGWPQNMIPKRYEANVIPIPEHRWHRNVFWL